MSYTQKLQELLIKQIIPDIDDVLDEIFEQIADEKNANAEQKEKIEELREFKSDLKDLLDEISSGEIEDEECQEIYKELLDVQQGAEEEE